MSGEPATEAATAFERNAERSERSRQCDAAIGNVEDEVVQGERFVGWRRHQLVDLSPADPPMDEPAAQTHSARNNAIDFEISVPCQPGLDVRVFRHEVRAARIADDEVADLLVAQPDTVEVVVGGNPPPLELTLQIMGRNRKPPKPDNDDTGEQHQQNGDG